MASFDVYPEVEAPPKPEIEPPPPPQSDASDASDLLFRPPLDILGSLSLDLAIRIAEPAAKRGAAAA